MMTNRPCRACKEAHMEEVVYSEDITVKGVDLYVEGLMRLQCPNCGAAIETAVHMDHNGELVKSAYHIHKTEFKKSHDLLTGEEIREYRTLVWNITQKQASVIFGGGPTAFSKYESEDVTQSNAMDKLLRLAADVPTAFDWLVKNSSNQETLQNILQRQMKKTATQWSHALMHFRNIEHTAEYTPQPAINKTLQICANDQNYNVAHDYFIEVM